MLTLLLEGLSTGISYAMVAMALALVVQATRVFDFSLAAVGAVGAYVGVSVASAGSAAAVTLAVVSSAATAWLLHRFVTRPISSVAVKTGLTVAVLLGLQSLLLLGFGGVPRALSVPGLLPDSSWVLFGTFWLLLLFLGLRLSRFGTALRALADDPELARAWGLPVEHIRGAVMAVSGATVAWAALAVGTRQGVLPGLLMDATLAGFAAAALAEFGAWTPVIAVALGLLQTGLDASLGFDAGRVLALLVLVVALVVRAERRGQR